MNEIIEILRESGVTEKKITLLMPVIENTMWMQEKLEETMTTIGESKVVIPYDNGGGQKGLRENPLYKGYESLWKSYMSGMSKILEALPADATKAIETPVESPKTMLELVREKHKKNA